MLKRGENAGNLAARLLASAALILVSGGYAWQQAVGNKTVRLRIAASEPPSPRTPHADVAPPVLAPPVTPPVSTPTPVVTAPRAAPRPDVAPAPRSALQNAPAAAPPAADAVPPPQNLASAAPPPQDAPAPHPDYADGDFTGDPVDCYWGTVQVEVVIKGGVITKVTAPQMPDHRDRSAEISEWAAPFLAQEVVQEQSADVDIISTATNTSVAYQQALASTLAKAKK